MKKRGYYYLNTASYYCFNCGENLTGMKLLERLSGEDYQTLKDEYIRMEYDGFTLPAGEYLALRVIIGEGQGQNWWCVVFPPLCTAASADVPASALAAGFSEEEVNLITEENQGYVLKFKAVEWWETLKEKWD